MLEDTRSAGIDSRRNAPSRSRIDQKPAVRRCRIVRQRGRCVRAL